MPDVSSYDNEKDWLADCIPTRIEEGDDQDQAVAACMGMWEDRNKDKALEFNMLLTKAERMKDGRTRWQARANTGEWDLERERFDVTFWEDVVHNFSRVQEATTKGEDVGLPIPILDIAHYSFRLPPEKRNMARAGYPIKLWQDGKALMAQGFFDDTPLGNAAAIAAQKRPVEDRRVSIGVWPDWGRVELDAEGRRIYKGGRDRAYLDHLAMTSAPVDPGTILEVKSMSQKQDALDVLGEEAGSLIDELEAATTKGQPDGAIVKAEETDAECPACEAPQPEQEPAPAPEQKAEGDSEGDDAEAKEESPSGITLEQLQSILSKLFEAFKSEISGQLGPVEASVEASVEQVEAIKARVDALGATETERVKAAVDSGAGDWWTELVKNSVQRRTEPVKGGPEQTTDTSDPFYTVFGGLKKKE